MCKYLIKQTSFTYFILIGSASSAMARLASKIIVQVTKLSIQIIKD